MTASEAVAEALKVIAPGLKQDRTGLAAQFIRMLNKRGYDVVPRELEPALSSKPDRPTLSSHARSKTIVRRP